MARYVYFAPLILILASFACGAELSETSDGAEEVEDPHAPDFPCLSDADCGVDYFCSSGECYYNGKPGDDGCYGHSACPEGTFCTEWGNCEAHGQIDACPGAESSWTERGTRAVFYQGFDGFEAHDLDGDGRDELLGWSVGGLQGFIDGEQRSLGEGLPAAHSELDARVFIDLDDDGDLDVFVRGREGASWIAFGLEGVELGAWQAGPELDVLDPIAVRWDPDAPMMLAGPLASESSKIGVYGDLLGAPARVEEFGATYPGTLGGLRALNLDGQGGDELFYRRYTHASVRSAQGWHVQVPDTFDFDHHFLTADFDADGDDEVASLEHGHDATLVNLLHGGAPELDEDGGASFMGSRFVVPGIYSWLLALRVRPELPPALFLGARDDSRLIHAPLDESPCYEPGPGFGEGFVYAHGDFDGDELDELARVDPEGRLSVLELH